MNGESLLKALDFGDDSCGGSDGQKGADEEAGELHDCGVILDLREDCKNGEVVRL